MLTVGIPVYNEGRYLEETIRSIVNQAEMIIICDNNSFDETEEICLRLSKEFQNIKYIRHEKNMGVLYNFKSCLDMATTEYFMWLGGHDLVSENYASELIALLEKDKEAVMAYTPTVRIDDNGEKKYAYDYPFSDKVESDDPFERVYSIINDLEQATMLHGVFKTEVLRKSYPNTRGFGPDSIILCNVARYGKLLYCLSGQYIRRDSIREQDRDIFKRRTLQFLGMSWEDTFQPYYNLQVEQLKTLESIDGDEIIKRNWLQKAEESLTKRWGQFSSVSFLKEYWFHKILIENRGISSVLSNQQLGKVVIFGTNRLGRYMYKDLMMENIGVKAFLDNNVDMQKESVYGINVHSPLWLLSNAEDISFVIVTIEGDGDKAVMKRLNHFVKDKNICVLSWKDLVRGNLAQGK